MRRNIHSLGISTAITSSSHALIGQETNKISTLCRIVIKCVRLFYRNTPSVSDSLLRRISISIIYKSGSSSNTLKQVLLCLIA